MPKHRQPTTTTRRARPGIVTAGALTILCTAAGVALAATPATPPTSSTAAPSSPGTSSDLQRATEPPTGEVRAAQAAAPAPETVIAGSSANASAPLQHEGGTWLSGASGDGAADGSLGEWRGEPVDIVGTWADVGDNQTQLWSIAPGGEVADFDGAIDIAPGGLQDGDTWAAAADGAYDDRWRESLTRMAELRRGRGTTYVRPFHEFNLAGWNWSVGPGDAEDFTAAWKRYRAVQQEAFPEARLVYSVNVTSSGTGLDWRTTWPGEGEADVLGVDTYNGWPTITSAADFDAQLQARGEDGIPIGLDAYAEQAADWGVPLAVPEWSGRAVMGDEPAYVTGMVEWFAANAGGGPGQLEYEVLFNAPQDDGNFQLFSADSLMPSSAQAYVDAVGAIGDGRDVGTSRPGDGATGSEFRSTASPPSPVAPSSAPTTPVGPAEESRGASVDPVDPDDQADVVELVARLNALLERLEHN